MPVRVVGIDPGFAAIGLAAVDLLHPAGATIRAVELLQTKPSHKKERLASSDDESRRLTEIEDVIIAFLDVHLPDVVAIEDPPWGKNAKAVRVCALMWGAAHALCRVRGLTVVNLTSQSIKKTVAGKRTASKEEVLDAIKAKYPFDGWPTTNAVEHVADAVGAALTSRTHPVVYALVGARLPVGRS